MQYELVQYSCDSCGNLTPVLDPDDKLPDGWVIVMPMQEEELKFRHLCPECAKKFKQYLIEPTTD